MRPLPYTIIKSRQQYETYRSVANYLTSIKKKTKDDRDTIELLNLLIEKWERDQIKRLPETDPPDLLQHLMQKNNLRPIDLATELDIKKSLLSDILHFKKGISKNMTRKLAKRFNTPEELFSKPYKLQ